MNVKTVTDRYTTYCRPRCIRGNVYKRVRKDVTAVGDTYNLSRIVGGQTGGEGIRVQSTGDHASVIVPYEGLVDHDSLRHDDDSTVSTKSTHKSFRA